MKQRQTPAGKSDKQEAIELIERLPDHISLETIISELLFKTEVLRRLEQVERGEVVSHEVVKDRMARWQPSNGR